MLRCSLCGLITRNKAEFLVSYGNHDNHTLKICKWCLQDLKLLGFNSNQIIRLKFPQHVNRVPLSLIVLGPVYTLLEAFNG